MAENLNMDRGQAKAKEPERRIGHGPPPPKHKPTKPVPEKLLSEISTNAIEECTRKAAEIEQKLRLHVGLPHYNKNGFVLYCGDCRNILAALQKEQIEVPLTVTSPPYNIGKEYEKPLSLDEYTNWCRTWMNGIYSVASKNGAFWLNLGYVEAEGKGKAVPLVYLLWNQSPFYLQQEIVWNYGAGVSTKYSFCPRNEKWLFFTKNSQKYTFNLDDVRDPDVKYPNQRKNGKYRCNPLGKNPSDVWQFPKVTTGSKRSSKERTSHPAQFPLALVDRIVRASSNANELVIDPFSGSGSAGIAAVGNGRPFLGVEIKEHYCNEASERFDFFIELRKESRAQLDMIL